MGGDAWQAIWTGTNDRLMYHSPSNLEPRCIHLHDWYSTRDTSGLLLVVKWYDGSMLPSALSNAIWLDCQGTYTMATALLCRSWQAEWHRTKTWDQQELAEESIGVDFWKVVFLHLLSTMPLRYINCRQLAQYSHSHPMTRMFSKIWHIMKCFGCSPFVPQCFRNNPCYRSVLEARNLEGGLADPTIR